MRTAIVHEWLSTIAGSERVVEQFCNTLAPEKIFTLIDHVNGVRPEFLNGIEIETSFIQGLPFAKSKYRGYLPFMPLAVEQFDLGDFDLVISSHHCVAHGAITAPDQLHVTYTHSPMRYTWDLQHQYFKESGLNKKWLRRKAAKAILHYLRIWDRAAGQRPDFMVANSHFIAARIRRCYGRKAHVIYPPVDVERFTPSNDREDFYLTASRFVPYKMVHLIVEAFSQMPSRKLIVIGDGPDRERIQKLAGPNVELLGYQPNAALIKHLQSAKAFIYAAEEDFGILPVEAQACGAPVIAYGRGGTRETVVDGKTGIHFPRQDVNNLVGAVERFESQESNFRLDDIRKHAEQFSARRFNQEFESFLDYATETFRCELHS